MKNSSVVQEIYAAFGRGDITTILNHLSESVEWEYGIKDNDVPWLKHGFGRETAKSFFAVLNQLEFRKFVPKNILEGPGLVIALIDVDFTVRATGKSITEEDEVHIWHFDEAGKVTRFGHRIDTLQHHLAIQP